jgi:hypothetical protein
MSRQWQYLKRVAADWLAPISAPGLGFQIFSVTGTGASPLTVTFADQMVNGETIKNMETTDYQVFLDGEFANDRTACYVDASSRAAAGFNIVGLGNNEIAHLWVVGRWTDMPDPSA